MLTCTPAPRPRWACSLARSVTGSRPPPNPRPAASSVFLSPKLIGSRIPWVSPYFNACRPFPWRRGRGLLSLPVPLLLEQQLACSRRSVNACQRQQHGGVRSRSKAGAGLPRHAAVARPVLAGRGPVTSACRASSSGFLPTQQLLIWVRAWEMLSAVSSAFWGPAPCSLRAISAAGVGALCHPCVGGLQVGGAGPSSLAVWGQRVGRPRGSSQACSVALGLC